MSQDVYVSFGAETGDLEAAMAKTKAEVSSLGRELAQTAREMQKSGQDMDSSLGEHLKAIGAKMAEAKEHMAELKTEIREAGEGREGGLSGLAEALKTPLESIEALKGALAGMAEMVAGAFALEKIVEWVNETAEAAEKIEREAEALGLAVGAIQKFRAESTLAGVSADGVVQSMEMLQRMLTKVESAGSPAAAVLKAMGIAGEEFRSLDMAGQLEELAQGFEKFADGPKKLAAAMTLFRGNGEEMLNFLNRGKEGFEELGQKVDETGVVMDGATVGAFAKLKEAENELGLATTALKQDLETGLAGPLIRIIGLAIRATEAIDRFYRSVKNPPLITGADFSAPADIPVLDPTGSALKDAMAGGPGRNVNVHKGKPEFPDINVGRGGKGGGGGAGHDDSAAVAREQLQDELSDVKDAAKQKLDAYNDDLSHHRTSVAAWLKDSETVLNQEAADVKKLYDEEASLAGQTAAEVARIKRQERQALRQINDQIAADERKAADEAQKSWESSLSTITGAFNSALKGMISGHETFRQAMMKSLEGLAFKALDLIEQTVIHHIAGELAKTAATAAGTAARTAAETGAAGAGAAADAAAALKSIMTSAAETFAGVFGFFAPVMGPFAAGPAAAAQATVMGAAGSIASADIGMWQVPGDQLAMIHKNELVMPAGQAGAFRDLLSGAASGGNAGGMAIHPTTNISVSGVADASWWRNNSSDVVKAVESGVRSGAALASKRLRAF
ncbi:hypothetical protein DFR50_14249 [Roseiarcus fermentans]|uniref:Uncharacterized protein n=1 Tax=Roseiarcus fermentans TaxID=1473586 RepID=A0A366EN61_9HYPH|nr:hypothetical protein [Roseiarcus fermentans]RBP03801.1 hypothetical protein DFR50_14249 [Roseiarcus fermentans]